MEEQDNVYEFGKNGMRNGFGELIEAKQNGISRD
jgi:hypothetical protein